MDTFTPISEEIPSIPKQTSSPTRVRSRWRVVAWIGGMGATGLVILIISMVVNHAFVSPGASDVQSSSSGLAWRCMSTRRLTTTFRHRRLSANMACRF